MLHCHTSVSIKMKTEGFVDCFYLFEVILIFVKLQIKNLNVKKRKVLFLYACLSRFLRITYLDQQHIFKK